MSFGLSGLNPLAYTGVEPRTPPNRVANDSDPTPFDINNFNLGDFWLTRPTQQAWVLVSKYGTVASPMANTAVWIKFTGGFTGVMSLTTQDNNVVTPTAGTINLIGSGSVATTGTSGPNTATIALTGITEFDVQTGGTSSTLHNVAPSATSGVPLVSQGSSAQPIFGTAVVPGGGTGDTSFTAYAPITGGTTTTGALQSADSGISTVGSVLTSTGASSLPTWQEIPSMTASSVISTGNSPLCVTSSIIFYAPSGGTTSLTSAAAADMVMPSAGNLNNFYVSTAANSNTADATLTFVKNGTPTTLSLTIPGSTTGVFSDTTHIISVVAGDLIAITATQATTGNIVGVASVSFTS